MKKEFFKKLTILEGRIIIIQKLNGQILYIKQAFLINYH